jgi:hypothetical protein
LEQDGKGKAKPRPSHLAQAWVRIPSNLRPHKGQPSLASPTSSQNKRPRPHTRSEAQKSVLPNPRTLKTDHVKAHTFIFRAFTITLLSPRTLTLTKADNYQLTTDNSSPYLLQYRHAARKKTVPVNTLTAPPAMQQHCSIADSMSNSPCHLRNDKIPSKENPSARVTRLRPAKKRLKFLDIGSFPQIEKLFTSRGC